METLVLIALIAVVILLLVFLAVLLKVLERVFPALSRFLDEHIGPGNGSPW